MQKKRSKLTLLNDFCVVLYENFVKMLFISEKASEQIAKIKEKGTANFGAGEGIRTLDPDLGKVVLYP